MKHRISLKAALSLLLALLLLVGAFAACQPNTPPADTTTEDSAMVFFRFEGGKTMTAEIAWAINGQEANDVTLFGSKAGCSFDPLTVYGEDEEGYLADVKPDVTPNNMFVEELRHFVDCLNTGKTPVSPMEDALTVQKMLDAIYRSAEAHAEVTI